MDRGLYTAPVNEYFGPENTANVLMIPSEYASRLLAAHEAGLTQSAQQPKVKERER